MKLLRRIAKQTVLEAQLHLQRRRLANTRPRVCLFPSNQPWDPASNLRAWLIAPELERLGWRVVVAPEPLSLGQRRRLLALEQPDVIFMQQTRHWLNQPKFYPEYPCVLDADDADYLDGRHSERIQTAAHDAAAVVGGSRFVASCLGSHNAKAYVLWTGTPLPPQTPVNPPGRRAPIVAWAHASPLAYPREAAFIREVMARVFRRSAGEFWLFGTDEEAASEWFEPIRAAGGKCRAIPPLSYESYLARVAECAIGLQPIAPENDFSQGKSFGKLLAYLAGQVAVVASNAVDHPIFFRHGDNGLMPEHNVDAWTDSICHLLDNPEDRSLMAMRGWQDFQDRLTSRKFALLLDSILREAAGLPLEEDHKNRLGMCLNRKRESPSKSASPLRNSADSSAKTDDARTSD